MGGGGTARTRLSDHLEQAERTSIPGYRTAGGGGNVHRGEHSFTSGACRHLHRSSATATADRVAQAELRDGTTSTATAVQPERGRHYNVKLTVTDNGG